MSIASPEFAAFVGLALVVYHVLPQRGRLWWLLACSYAFAAIEAWRFVPVLAAVTALTFAVAAKLRSTATRRNTWLWAGVLAILATLGALRWAYRSDPFAGPFAVVGVSFYTLQAISYLLDTHSGALRSPNRLGDLAVYLAYFPKLVAGPIERARVFLPHLEHPRIVDDLTVGRAATLIAVGVTRKLAIADPLRAAIPDQAFTSPTQLGAAALVSFIVAYAFALYNDFAAYTNIARGVSSLFGIELSINFAQPFFARSFTEFWNRWHITLSHWLRDYIYLPVSRVLLRRDPSLWNVPNLILPPLLTMLAAGLWHGTSAHMLLWGGLHGCYLIAERVLGLWFPARIGARSAWKRIGGALIVFTLGCAAMVFFRADTRAALAWWSTVLHGAAGGLPNARMAWYFALSLWLDWMESRHGADTLVDHWPRVGRAAVLAMAMLLCFLATRAASPAPFIYRGF